MEEKHSLKYAELKQKENDGKNIDEKFGEFTEAETKRRHEIKSKNVQHT